MSLETKALSFHPVHKTHQEVILKWLEKSHVRKYYYGQGLKNTLEQSRPLCKWNTYQWEVSL